MYAKPDTVTIELPNITVRLACYSTAGAKIADQLADYLTQLVHNQADYLGGRLATDKYIIEKSSKALREKDHHLCRPPRAAQRHRQGVSFVAAQQGHLGAEALGKQVRETGEHTHGQRSRVYSQNSAKLEQDKRDRVQIYNRGNPLKTVVGIRKICLLLNCTKKGKPT